MGNKWVLSVRTSLPVVCRSKDYIRTVFYVYDSFEEARAAMRAEIGKYAGQKNAIFDGAGRIKKMTDFISYIGKIHFDHVIQAEDMIHRAIGGETVGIGDIPEMDDGSEPYVTAVRCGDALKIFGHGDGPCNGYDPYIKTNIFDMGEEKHYYLYIDDLFEFCDDDIYSSELYIDLKKAEN